MQTAPPVASRSLLVDVVRGLAIALVAVGHIDQGTIRMGWWGTSIVGWQIAYFIYTFHMPAFFFVSGIFLSSSVARRGPVKFINNKVAQMLYPYLLWSVLTYALVFPLQRFVHTPNPPVPVFLKAMFEGETLWFLPAIFLCVLLGMLLRNVNKPLLFAAAVAVSLLPVKWYPNFILRTIEHFPFLVAGMWVARGYERLEKISVPVAAFGAAVLAGLVFVVSHGALFTSRWTPVPVGLAGTLMLFLVARCCSRDSFARTMAWVGEASFGVYLMSAYGQGLGREILLRALHTTEPYLQLIFPSLLAIFIPAWIYQHRMRLRLGWLFLWPF